MAVGSGDGASPRIFAGLLACMGSVRYQAARVANLALSNGILDSCSFEPDHICIRLGNLMYIVSSYERE